MFSNHRNRRCAAICLLLPSAESTQPGRSAQELLQKLVDEYGDCSSPAGRLRALQRDLKQMLEENTVVCSSQPGEGKTLRYKRAPQNDFTAGNNNLIELKFSLQQQGLPPQVIDDILRRLRTPDSYFELPPSLFLSVPDTVQLFPLKACDSVLQAEITTALRQKWILKAVYRSANDAEARERRLHLVGLIRRGPQFYLVAYDENNLAEPHPQPKLYKLQRLEDALALNGEISHPPSEPTLEALALKFRIAEFVQDTTPVIMKLRVWGYARSLLEENVLSPDQCVSQDPEDVEAALVSASVIQSGTLYRWLLGFGDKVEVLAPPNLRAAIAKQAAAATEYYSDIYVN